LNVAAFISVGIDSTTFKYELSVLDSCIVVYSFSSWCFCWMFCYILVTSRGLFSDRSCFHKQVYATKCCCWCCTFSAQRFVLCKHV